MLQSNGALQIVSPQRGVLGSTPAAAPVTTVPAPKPAAIRAGVNYTIQSMMTGKCYDVPDDRPHQWDCHGNASQQWRFEDQGSGACLIVNTYTGKRLKVVGLAGSFGVSVATSRGGNPKNSFLNRMAMVMSLPSGTATPRCTWTFPKPHLGMAANGDRGTATEDRTVPANCSRSPQSSSPAAAIGACSVEWVSTIQQQATKRGFKRTGRFQPGVFAFR